jgi:hypothetical protein
MKAGDWVEWVGNSPTANNPNIGRVLKLGRYVGERPKYKHNDWWTFTWGELYIAVGKPEKLGQPIVPRYVRARTVRPIVGGLKERQALRVAAKILHGF